MSGWISVKDRLPNRGDMVLVFNGASIVARFTGIFKDHPYWERDFYDPFGDLYKTVTHWQPLPPPPQDN